MSTESEFLKSTSLFKRQIYKIISMFPNIRAIFVHNYSNPLHNDDAAQRVRNLHVLV